VSAHTQHRDDGNMVKVVEIVFGDVVVARVLDSVVVGVVVVQNLRM
jgi:hypothetical protein